MKKTGVFPAREPRGKCEEEFFRKISEGILDGSLGPFNFLQKIVSQEDLRIMREIKICSSDPKNFPGKKESDKLS